MPNGQVRLLIAAAPAEGRAVLRAFGLPVERADRAWVVHPLDDRHELIVSGIGKANAAGAAGRFVDPSRHGLVLSVGVAGALPQAVRDPGSEPTKLPLHTPVLGTFSCFADEGLQTADGFTDCAQMGFPIAPSPFGGNAAKLPADLSWKLHPLATAHGGIATVSTCSGTDALAAQVASRTGALAEAMEGAAIAVVAARLSAPFAELRTISNTTGDRSRQQWDLKGALSRLTDVIGRLRGLA